jgi:SAM-dependent methyltransferase
MERSEPRFRQAQHSHFLDADEAQYRWTTTAPGVAETEDELLAPILALLRSPCLEMGCGEGNNLQRFTQSVRCIGIDRFKRKLQFANRELHGSAFASADAAALPFPDASFESVFIRDLLHHLPEPEAALREAVRVLRPGGRLCLLEPNGRNPLIRLQTHLVPAEIGARESTPESIRALLEAQPLQDLRLEARQPLALRRMAFHYRMGLPALGRFAVTAALLRGLERAAGALVPRSCWTYIEATAIRASQPAPGAR